MMVKRLLVLLPMALLFARCDTPLGPREVGLGEVFDINVGQTATVRGEELNLVFDGVPEDSRCPQNVDCVWQGNAKVVLRLEKGRESGRVELNTGMEPRSGEFMDYSVRLVDLMPAPSADKPIPQDAYVARLVVTKR